MKKILAILITLILAFGLFACGSSTASSPAASSATPGAAASPSASAAASSSSAAKPSASASPSASAAASSPALARPAPSATDKLVVAHKGDPTGLCPLGTTNVSTNGPILTFLYDSLVHFNSDTKKFEPAIASSWKYIDDTHIQFTLRQDVTSWDGSKITASDVIFTYKTAQDGGFLGNYIGKFDVPNCKAVDDYTVILATKVAEPYIFYTIANAALGIESQKAVEAGGGVQGQLTKPTAGCGPYKFVKWDRGTSVVLERNDNYYGDKAYFKTVEFRIIADASARLMNLQSGDVDVALDPVASQVSQLQGDKNFTVANIETATLTTMYLNCSGSFAPFTDVKVRQAIALALNYKDNLNVAVGAYGNTSDSFLPKLSPAYSAPGSTDKNYYHYDVAAAKAMLAQSGYKDGFTFSLKYAENSMFKALAELIQNQLKVLNITVKVTPEDSSAFSTDIAKGDYEAEMINSSNPDPAVVMNLIDGRLTFKQVQGGSGWKGTDELYKFMDLARGTIDEAKRKDAYKSVQSIANEACPVVPLVSQNRIITSVSSLKGITLTVFTDVDLSRAYRAK